MPYLDQTEGPEHFRVAGYVHHPGDVRCQKCRVGYPWRCAEGGLVHAEIRKEDVFLDKRGHYELRCEKCRYTAAVRRPDGTESPHWQVKAPWPDARCLQETD